MKKLFILIALTPIFHNCSYIIENYKENNKAKYISITAELSDTTGATFVDISYTSTSIISPVLIPVIQAKVLIIDDKNNSTYLKESRDGLYKPEIDYRGQSGTSYKLKIETTEGGVYESDFEKMPQRTPIDLLYDEFEENKVLQVDNPKRYFYHLYTDFTDRAGEPEFYQWKLTHYSKTQYCKVCTSGFWAESINSCYPTNVANAPNMLYRCNSECFDIQLITDNILLSDKLVDGNKVKRQSLYSIPFGDLTRYYLLVEQRKLTLNAFNYFNALKQQSENTGSQFDVPALTRFSSNIKSLTNKSEKIIGVWNVFSSVQQPHIIERGRVVVPNYSPQVEIIKGVVDQFTFLPCDESPFRTKTPPPGWR